MWLLQISLMILGLIALAFLLRNLHRLLLRLEERGWIYYKHKRPQSGALSCLGALQEAIEPGYQHVVQIRQELQQEASQRDVLLARLLSCLQADLIDRESIRQLLLVCDHEEGIALYREAVGLAAHGDEARVATFPHASDVV